MDNSAFASSRPDLPSPPFNLTNPAHRQAPIVIASPHSGRVYPSDFVASSRLDFQALRRSEDSFVDELFSDAPDFGVALLQAYFPRAYCDVNREPWELDPTMFTETLPTWCNTSSARVLAGFGTIARLVATGEPIYGSKLRFAEAECRIVNCWKPYHDALKEMIAASIAAHGACLLLDAHSMPSIPATQQPRGSTTFEPDFVLGDAFGTSCSPLITQRIERLLRDLGFRVRRNDPYAGGYVTRHYGRPSRKVHVLQIEICRSLYMDEHQYAPLAAFAAIRTQLMSMLGNLVAEIDGLLRAPDQ